MYVRVFGAIGNILLNLYMMCTVFISVPLCYTGFILCMRTHTVQAIKQLHGCTYVTCAVIVAVTHQCHYYKHRNIIIVRVDSIINSPYILLVGTFEF